MYDVDSFTSILFQYRKQEKNMKKQEFKQQLYSLLDMAIDDMSYEEKVNYIEKLVFDYQRDNDKLREKPNSQKAWKDEELKLILNDAATVENCVKYAKIFGRGYGSIEQIYRWAATPLKNIQGRRENDSFVLQIKRVARQLGRRA